MIGFARSLRKEYAYLLKTVQLLKAHNAQQTLLWVHAHKAIVYQLPEMWKILGKSLLLYVCGADEVKNGIAG
jgi:hypothetical protein